MYYLSQLKNGETRMQRDPSQNTLIDSFKELASRMPIPDEFEYEFEFQDGKSTPFTYNDDDTDNCFAEHPQRDPSSLDNSHRSPMILRNDSVLQSAERAYNP